MDEDLLAIAAAPTTRALVETLAGKVEPAGLPDLAEEAARQWTGNFNPRPVDAANLLELYRQAH